MDLLGINVVFFILIFLLPFVSESIRFDLESGHVKCISEDIKINSLTVGHYSIVNPNEEHPMPQHHKMSVRVFTVKGNQQHTADDVDSGQFTFTVEEDGDHLACFSAVDHEPPVNISVEFKWASGVAAKGDWSSALKKDRVDGMQVELKKMEDIVASIHEEMFYLRWREQRMQDLTRITNSRMGWLSLVSLLLCLSVAGLQLWHLKSFFEKKKII